MFGNTVLKHLTDSLSYDIGPFDMNIMSAVFHNDQFALVRQLGHFFSYIQ